MGRPAHPPEVPGKMILRGEVGVGWAGLPILREGSRDGRSVRPRAFGRMDDPARPATAQPVQTRTLTWQLRECCRHEASALAFACACREAQPEP